MSTQPREKNPNWKGGRSVASNGYVLIKVGTDHHLADVRGYAYEHRIVAEKKIGRRLLKGEQVHHLNGDKTDNREDNIEVVGSRFDHAVKHRRVMRKAELRLPGEPNEAVMCACGCGILILRYDKLGRPRSFVSGHNIHPRQA